MSLTFFLDGNLNINMYLKDYVSAIHLLRLLISCFNLHFHKIVRQSCLQKKMDEFAHPQNLTACTI